MMRAILAATLFATGVAAAAAQSYPTQPIRLIVSAVPGAATDILARSIGDRLSSKLGQPIVVENRPGASSMLAAEQVANATPDGYTLMVSPNSLLVAPHMLPKGSAGGVNVVRDLVPVIVTGTTPLTLLAYPGVGVKSVADLLAVAHRGRVLTYASGGTGSALHLAGELFQKAAGIKLMHVPYKGLAQATTDVVAGTVDLMFGTPGAVMGDMINTGRLIPLAVAQKQRSPLLPDVPTMHETGVDGAEFDAWFMMFAPAATPQPVLATLNREIAIVLKLPELQQRLTAVGMEPGGGSLEDAARKVRIDFERYGQLVADAGIGHK